MRSRFARLTLRPALTILFAAAAFAATVVLIPVAGATTDKPVSTAIYPSPNTYTNCLGFSSDLNGEICFEIVGSRNYISTMTATQYVMDYSVTGHIEITGAGGYTSNSDDAKVTPSQPLKYEKDVYAYVTPGTWCSVFWEHLVGNEYTQYDQACITVNS